IVLQPAPEIEHRRDTFNLKHRSDTVPREALHQHSLLPVRPHHFLHEAHREGLHLVGPQLNHETSIQRIYADGSSRRSSATTACSWAVLRVKRQHLALEMRRDQSKYFFVAVAFAVENTHTPSCCHVLHDYVVQEHAL